MQSSPIRNRFVRLGSSDLEVYRIGLGAWPMAGITSLGVTDEASAATIHRALDLGINHIDTAYAYGLGGRSDRVIAGALAGRPERVVLASKVGARLDDHGVWMNEASPEAIVQQAREIRERLCVDALDLMYLHAPDPKVPLAESADALKSLVDRGWVRWAGVSNVDLPQLELFHGRCPVVAVQTYFNMFQQDSVQALRDFCERHTISLVVYWVLMKGLLAGAMTRNHTLAPEDRRRKYPIYQGEQWQAAQDLLDQLRILARDKQCTVSQLVIAWTLLQPSIDVALIGAKRPDQIEETAIALEIPLTSADLGAIDSWIASFQGRGEWAR
jgi:aryl-alcohol dehydrogenase-like predicted oxidoreductase